jgi:hypothetical protein
MVYHIWINCGFSTDILYEADSQIGEFHLYWDYDKSNPRIQIGIRNVVIRRLTGRQMDEPSLSTFLYLNLWTGLLLFAALRGLVGD